METENQAARAKPQAPDVEEDDSDQDNTEEQEFLDFKFEFTPEFNQTGAFQGVELERAVIALYGAASIYFNWKCGSKNSKNFKKIAQVNFSRQKQSSLATLYGTIDCKEIILAFNAEVYSHQNHKFSEIFFGTLFKVKKILLVDTVSYQALLLQPIEKTELRWLKNSWSNSQAIAQQLEAGQSLEGLAADIVSYAEIKGIPADVLIGVTVEFELLAEHTLVFDALQPHLKWLAADTTAQQNIQELKSLTAKYNKLKYSSNIYI